MTERETAKIIALLREYYRDTVSTTETAKVKAWHLLLRDYSYEAAEKAVIELASFHMSEFMPAPARLLEILRRTGAQKYERDDLARLKRLLAKQKTTKQLTARKEPNHAD